MAVPTHKKGFSRERTMKWTRREWMQAAGLMPLQITTTGRGGRASEGPAVVLGPPAALPDKTSFPDLSGVYLNSAASHPRSAGATALVKKALLAEGGDASGFRPNENRVREYFAKLINADVDEIAFVPSTQIGESFVAAALGIPAKGAHVVSDYLHFVGSQMMYTDMAKRGVEVTWPLEAGVTQTWISLVDPAGLDVAYRHVCGKGRGTFGARVQRRECEDHNAVESHPNRNVGLQ